MTDTFAASLMNNGPGVLWYGMCDTTNGNVVIVIVTLMYVKGMDIPRLVDKMDDSPHIRSSRSKRDRYCRATSRAYEPNTIQRFNQTAPSHDAENEPFTCIRTTSERIF
ncbi:hypothetical protein CBL_07903 [Carabus blaptoides fortunei]